MTVKIVKLEDVEEPLDVRLVTFGSNVKSIRTDGTFDGTGIEKDIGYVLSKPHGEAILNDGSKIVFSSCRPSLDMIIIDKPYFKVTS